MTSNQNKTPVKQASELKRENDSKGRDQSSEKKNQGRQNSKNENHEQRSDQRDRRDNRGENRFDKNRRGGRFGNFNQRGGRGGMQIKQEGGSSGGNFQSNQQVPDFTGEIQNEEPKEQKKFTGRCRLFVGNITPDTTEEQFKEMFTPYGEVSEIFVNAARGFGFIRLVKSL